MLKVTVKNEKAVDERWERGMIRMSENGSVVIMIVLDNEDDELIAIKLKDAELNGRLNRADRSGKDFWIDYCPVVVENAELIIGGN